MLKVEVDLTDGAYGVLVNGRSWLISAVAAALHANGIWYQPAFQRSHKDAPLRITHAERSNATDKIGIYDGISFEWAANNSTLLKTTVGMPCISWPWPGIEILLLLQIKVYRELPVVVFGQQFLKFVGNSSLHNSAEVWMRPPPPSLA